ncbi:6275_t:CDS:1, partial [Gigaspora margarita]
EQWKAYSTIIIGSSQAQKSNDVIFVVENKQIVKASSGKIRYGCVSMLPYPCMKKISKGLLLDFVEII